MLNSVGRVGRVDDIANAVTFLASPLAGFINDAITCGSTAVALRV